MNSEDTVRHYHADNGLLDTKSFKTSISKAALTLSLCGVNAHHQNKDITQGAHNALLHAAHRWPKAIDSALCPTALKNYVNLPNALPTHVVPESKNGRRFIPVEYHDLPCPNCLVLK